MMFPVRIWVRGFGAENVGGFYYRYGWKFGSKEALTYIKTYLYSGDLGAEKVVKSIEKSRIDELEEELSRLKKVFRDHFMKKANQEITNKRKLMI